VVSGKATSAPVVVGSVVHISDASPRGWSGRVIASRSGWLIVVRGGHCELIDTSRRHVTVQRLPDG
jgi:hypothetical protein